LALASFKNQKTKEIRKNLWEGGKSNHKIFHLINWNTVTTKMEKRGLEIRDPKTMNLALGAKLVWQLFGGKEE